MIDMQVKPDRASTSQRYLNRRLTTWRRNSGAGWAAAAAAAAATDDDDEKCVGASDARCSWRCCCCCCCCCFKLLVVVPLVLIWPLTNTLQHTAQFWGMLPSHCHKRSDNTASRLICIMHHRYTRIFIVQCSNDCIEWLFNHVTGSSVEPVQTCLIDTDQERLSAGQFDGHGFNVARDPRTPIWKFIHYNVKWTHYVCVSKRSISIGIRETRNSNHKCWLRPLVTSVRLKPG